MTFNLEHEHILTSEEDIEKIIDDYYLDNKVHNLILFEKQFNQFVSTDALVDVLVDSRFKLFELCPFLRRTEEYRRLRKSRRRDSEIEMLMELTEAQNENYAKVLEQFVEDNAVCRSSFNIHYKSKNNKVVSLIPSKIFDPEEIARFSQALCLKLDIILEDEDAFKDFYESMNIEGNQQTKDKQYEDKFKEFSIFTYSRTGLKENFKLSGGEISQLIKAGVIAEFLLPSKKREAEKHKHVKTFKIKNDLRTILDKYVSLYEIVTYLKPGAHYLKWYKSITSQLILDQNNLPEEIKDVGELQPYFVIPKNQEEQFLVSLGEDYEFHVNENQCIFYSTLFSFKTPDFFKKTHDLDDRIELNKIMKEETKNQEETKIGSKIYSFVGKDNQPYYFEAQMIKVLLDRYGNSLPTNILLYRVENNN